MQNIFHSRKEKKSFFNLEHSGDSTLELLIWLLLSGLAARRPAPYVWTIYSPVRNYITAPPSSLGRATSRCQSSFCWCLAP